MLAELGPVDLFVVHLSNIVDPNLSFGEDFAESAETVGISYEDLLQKIITLGLNYQAEWRLV